MKSLSLKQAREWSSFSMAACLHLIGWASMNVLCSVGFFAFLLFLLGGFTPEGFFAQVGNLSSRFLNAPAEARTQFVLLASVVLSITFAGLCLFRFRALEQAIFHEEQTQ